MTRGPVVGSFRSPGALHPPRFNAAEAADVPSDTDAEAVSANEITIAKVLHDRGYHTIHLGKWHLGGIPGSRPEQKGFDESLGFMAGASLYAPVDDPNVENSKQDFDPIDKFLWGALPYSVQFNGSKPFHPNAYMTDYLTDQALSTLGESDDRGGDPRAFRVHDHFRLVPFHDRDHGVGGAEVDADDFGHIVFSSLILAQI